MPGWLSGNSMAIMFGHVSGAGVRWVESSSTMNDVGTPTLMWAVADAGCTTVFASHSVNSLLDGAEETVGSGNMYMDSSDYELMYEIPPVANNLSLLICR